MGNLVAGIQVTNHAKFKGSNGKTYVVETAPAPRDAVAWAIYDDADLVIRVAEYRGTARWDGKLQGVGPAPLALLGTPFATWIRRRAKETAEQGAAERAARRAKPAKTESVKAPWYKDWSKLLGDD